VGQPRATEIDQRGDVGAVLGAGRALLGFENRLGVEIGNGNAGLENMVFDAVGKLGEIVAVHADEDVEVEGLLDAHCAWFVAEIFRGKLRAVSLPKVSEAFPQASDVSEELSIRMSTSSVVRTKPLRQTAKPPARANSTFSWTRRANNSSYEVIILGLPGNAELV
jgi:hypothetical protein